MHLSNELSLIEESGVLVIKEALTGELIHEPINESITPEQLEDHVKEIEKNNIQTSMIFIFNDKIFETHSAIVHYQGHWLFWHGFEYKLMTWDWQKDIDEIIASFDCETENESMNSGWEIYSDNSYDFFNIEFESVEETFQEELDKFVSTLSKAVR